MKKGEGGDEQIREKPSCLKEHGKERKTNSSRKFSIKVNEVLRLNGINPSWEDGPSSQGDWSFKSEEVGLLKKAGSAHLKESSARGERKGG